MFRAYVVVVQVSGLFNRVFDDFLGPWGLRKLPHRHHVGTTLDELFDFQTHLPEVHVKVFQDVGSYAAALLDQAQKDMFGADVLVVETLGLLIGQRHHLSGPIRKPFEHVHLLLAGTTSRPLIKWGGLLFPPAVSRQTRYFAVFIIGTEMGPRVPLPHTLITKNLRSPVM